MKIIKINSIKEVENFIKRLRKITISITLRASHCLILNANSTVYTYGLNYTEQYNIKNWKDIIDISLSTYNMVD